MPKIVIVHRWEGYPATDWYPWLKLQLEKRGFEVSVPKMPNPHMPDIEAWVEYLERIAGEVNGETFFVGHSVGCQAILRFLEALERGKAGGAVFVAGWFNLKEVSFKTEEEKKIAKPWIETPIDFEKVKSRCKKFISIFSDDDPFVPLADADIFRGKLGSHLVIEKGKGHFTIEDGFRELPVALESVLKLTG